MPEVQETRKPNRFRITSIIIAVVMLVGAFGALIGPFSINVSAAPDTHTWDGGGADVFAGTHANWVTDIAPEAGDSTIFNAGALPCTWNLSITLNAFSMNVGYSGVVTLGASFGVSSYSQAAGTLTGSASYTLTDSGAFTKTGGTITADVLKLVMTGDATLATSASFSLYSFQASGNITTTGTWITNRITVDAGKTFTISSGQTITYECDGTTLSNSGAIAGAGKFQIQFTWNDRALAPGEINSLLEIKTHPATPDNRIMTLSGALTGTSALSIYSSSASKTMKLATSTFALTSGSIILGARGLLLQGTGVITATSFVQNGASSNMTQGGNVVVSGATTLTNGNLTGTTSYTWSTNTFTQSICNVSASLLRLTATGNITCNNATRFYDLSAQDNLTINFNIFDHDLIVASGKTLTLSNVLYWYDWAGGSISNLGTITGASGIEEILFSSNVTRSYGLITAPLMISATNTAWSNLVVTLGAAATLDFLTIRSSHATYTMTLDTANYSMSVNGIMFGPRGILNARSSEITNSGNAFSLPRQVEVTAPTDVITGTKWLGPGNAMVQATNGDYLAFIRNGTTHVSPGDYAVMDLYRSTDGVSWVKESILRNVTNRDVRNFCAGVTNTGRVIVFFGIYDIDNYTWPSNISYCYSDDNGTTWSADLLMPMPTINGFAPINSGGAAYGLMKEIGGGGYGVCFSGGNGTYAQLRFARTFDNGLTWGTYEMAAPLIVGQSLTETAFAYLGDDKLVAMARRDGHTDQEMFTSIDNGVTWTDRGSKEFGLIVNNPPILITSQDTFGELWVIGLFVVGHYVCSVGIASDLMASGTTAWSSPTTIGTGYGVYLSGTFNDTTKTGLFMTSGENSSSVEAHTLTIDTTASYTLLAGSSTVILSGNNTYFNTKAGNDAYNLNISGTSVQLFMPGVSNNLTIETGGSATLGQNICVGQTLRLNGNLAQGGNRLNISGSSSTPLIGYGAFDGDIYLNGSLASSYQIQVGLPMGHLHTDRDTTISLDADRSLRVVPSTVAFINISMTSATVWTAEASDPTASITFTLSGLESGMLYNVYVDGERIEQIRSESGTITFSYSGPWSEHTFEVEMYDAWGPLYDMGPVMLYIGVTVGLIAIMLVAVGSRLKRR